MSSGAPGTDVSAHARGVEGGVGDVGHRFYEQRIHRSYGCFAAIGNRGMDVQGGGFNGWCRWPTLGPRLV